MFELLKSVKIKRIITDLVFECQEFNSFVVIITLF